MQNCSVPNSSERKPLRLPKARDILILERETRNILAASKEEECKRTLPSHHWLNGLYTEPQQQTHHIHSFGKLSLNTPAISTY